MTDGKALLVRPRSTKRYSTLTVVEEGVFNACTDCIAGDPCANRLMIPEFPDMSALSGTQVETPVFSVVSELPSCG